MSGLRTIAKLCVMCMFPFNHLEGPGMGGTLIFLYVKLRKQAFVNSVLLEVTHLAEPGFEPR